MNKSNEFIKYLEDKEILEEGMSSKLQDVLRIIVNLLKVRGISLNHQEQENVVQNLSKIIMR